MTGVSADASAVEGRALSTAEARLLVELCLIRNDLRAVIRSLSLRESLLVTAPDSDGSHIATCLFRDAIVQYMACFGSKPPQIQFDDVYGDTAGAGEFFQWIKDLRDAYAAHSFGASRQGEIAAARAPGLPGTVVLELFNVYAGPVPGEGQFLAFVSIALEHIERRVALLQAEVVAAAEAMSDDQYSALPAARLYGLHPNEIRSTRERLRRSKQK